MAEHNNGFDEIMESLRKLKKYENTLKIEIEIRQRELKEIQKNYIKLAYILGGGNIEGIEDDTTGNQAD